MLIMLVLKKDWSLNNIEASIYIVFWNQYFAQNLLQLIQKALFMLAARAPVAAEQPKTN